MNSASTAANPSPKRTRFADEIGAQVTSSPTDSISPIAAARNKIISGTATLHTIVQPQARTEAFKILNLYARLNECKAKRTKFASPEFIPRSARFKFALTPPSDLRESPEAKLLVAEAETAMELCRTTITDTMRRLVDLEIVELSKKFDKSLVEFCCFLAKINALFNDGTINNINKTFLLAWKGCDQIKGNRVTDNDEKEIFDLVLEHFPATTKEGAALELETAKQAAADETDLGADLLEVVTLVTTQIQNIIVKSLDIFDATLLTRDRSLKVTEYIKQLTMTTAADAVAMELDNEPSTDPTTIKRLIAEEVAKATKKLAIQQPNAGKQSTTAVKTNATDTSSAKNVKRGANNSASLKKKTIGKSKTIVTTKHSRTASKKAKSADDVASDTSAASSKNGNVSSKRKKGGKRPPTKMPSKK